MMNFRPTLIIGLGGSGSFVVRRLKKRLRRLVQSELPPSLQLLAFDTDAQKSLDLLEELTPAEFYLLSNFNGSNYTTTAARAANPAIAAFWQYQHLTVDFVQNGASQRPPVGRLALFVHFDTVVKHIAAAVQKMFRPAADYVPPPNINVVDVYIAGSSCGGTGAGMFFDMALLSRYLVTQTTREAILQGHVFLPSCFEGAQTSQTSLQMNALAFLKTMEAVQGITVPSVLYPGFQTDELSAPLFSRVHLMSGVDVTGVRAADVQSVYETVALQMDLEISSAAARDMRSATDNCPPDFNNRPGGRLATYSSYGAAILTGASNFGRLSVLPAFCSRVVQALATERTTEVNEPETAVRNAAFRRTLDILESDDAALELVPDFQPEAMRLVRSENPVDAVRSLVRRVDALSATLSLTWLSTLTELPAEIKQEISTRMEAGTGGIPRAITYLTQVKSEVQKLNARVESGRAAAQVSADEIVAKVRGFFVRRSEQQHILETQGYAFLKSQTLARVRDALARKVQAEVTGWLRDVSTKLDALEKFSTGAQPFVETAERYSRESIAKHRATLGANSNTEDTSDICARFESKSRETVERFFASSEGRRAIRVISQALAKGETSEMWSNTLLEAADEFLILNLAESVSLAPDWPEQAAREIASCQPMVQFVADHNNAGARPTRFAYARAYDKDRVAVAVQTRDPNLAVTIERSNEPGTLEVSAMALNFALYQIQETRLIETGYRRFASTQPESPENRYAWRGPTGFWNRIKQLSLFPLTPREQAVARALALYPVLPARPIATVTVGGFQVNGEYLDVDTDASQYFKYQTFNRRLVSDGHAERLLREWKALPDQDKIREHLQSLIAKLDDRIQRASTRLDDEGGPAFLSLLEEERNALADEARREQL